ncbi:MAG: HD domain-containing protein [Bacteroidales bacterium]|jgi:poly(A) polymerase|nr:HD domain-containing protein [Bacteroidales bacterium]
MNKQPSQKELICHLNLPIFNIISEEADALGRECYVVGGFVRDIFLERPSKDIDCVTVGSGIELAEHVAKRLGRGAHLSVFRNFGTAQVKFKGTEVEFVGARKESYSHDSRKPVVEDGTLEDDQNRRDLTINDMAICLNKARFGELVDPFHGMDDLEAGLIRTPLNPDITFSDDPLRMLRAIRFACRFKFKIVPETFEAIARNRERIKIISGERIIDELNKIMMCEQPSTGWLLLQRCGLLQIIFPELQALSGIETREGRGHKDNFMHTLTVLDNVCRAQQERKASAKNEPSDKNEKTLDTTLWLRWAAIMHDLGKAKAKAWDDKIGWTFHNHDYLGSRMVPGIFRRLKLPMGAEMKFVEKLVALHMRPINLADEGITDSAIRRVLFEAGDDIDDLMTLCEADITSKIPEKVRRFLDNFKVVRQKMVEIEEKDRIRNWQPPVDGLEIMQRYKLSPCREVGLLKDSLKDAILDGICANDRDDAIAFLDNKAKELGIL